MKWKWKIGILLVGIALLVGSGVVAMQESVCYFYEGKEVFQTTQEYTTFKEAVGVSEIDIWEMLVLSSEPPIVVDYQVEAPRNLDFPYGEAGLLPSSIPFALLLAFGVVVTVAGGVLIGLDLFGKKV